MAQVDVDLRGKGAIVTGGGSGICLSFVQHLYRAGCNVLICDLALHREAVAWLDTIHQKDISDDTTQQTTPPSGPRVAFLKTDVSDWKQLEAAFEGYAREFGGGVPDVVCPGAGVYEPSWANFWNDSDAAAGRGHYSLLRINLEHPLQMSRIAIRRMLTPLYGAAKQGISNFTRGMARLQDMEGIRVVAVAPGPTMSPLMYDHPEALRFVDPAKDRLSAPDEIARGMMAVAFDRARFPPGTVLEVTHPDRWREVALLNDPGPGPHAFTSRKEEGMADVYAALEADRRSAPE
ncbi:hypothetical protein CLAIMM_00278 [Cladophialophora immunda]|nr:hypothetical protein CLAIMM_00278 [Cladophialophora immunda]